MQYEVRRQFHGGRIVLLVCIVAVSLLTVFGVSSAARPGFDPTLQRDAIRLENRITQLEQRLFSIENSLRNLDQQSRMAGAGLRGVTPEDLARLRFEVQALQQRLAEHECGLAKLDERTLSPAMRAVRRKSGAGGTDPCRLNFETPLQMPDARR